MRPLGKALSWFVFGSAVIGCATPTAKPASSGTGLNGHVAGRRLREGAVMELKLAAPPEDILSVVGPPNSRSSGACGEGSCEKWVYLDLPHPPLTNRDLRAARALGIAPRDLMTPQVVLTLMVVCPPQIRCGLMSWNGSTELALDYRQPRLPSGAIMGLARGMGMRDVLALLGPPNSRETAACGTNETCDTWTYERARPPLTYGVIAEMEKAGLKPEDVLLPSLELKAVFRFDLSGNPDEPIRGEEILESWSGPRG